MRTRLHLLLAAAAVALLPGCASGAPALQPRTAADADCPTAPRTGMTLAHPVLTGEAGPFARTTLVLEQPATPEGAPFAGRLVTPSGCLVLAGPDEPADFFMFYVRAVLFTPLGPDQPRGIVVLASRERIGPGHGTDHVAFVYRVTGERAERLPALEERLDGARTAAEARARLAARR